MSALGNSKSLRVKNIVRDNVVGISEPVCRARDFAGKKLDDRGMNNFVIVIMTYKRVDKLEKILRFLSKFGKGGGLLQNYGIDIVITQSCDTDAPETVAAVENLLKRYSHGSGVATEGTPFHSVKHVKVPLMKHDDSYSTDKKMYGNKRNSLQNLKNGLSVALATHSRAEDFLILEDDAVISCDIFEIIKFLRADLPNWGDHKSEEDNLSNTVDNKYNRNKRSEKDIELCTLDALFRPSLYLGNYVEQIGEQIASSNEKRLNSVYVNPRTTIKTFAYILKRSMARQYTEALDLVDTDADSFAQGGFFHNCNFCQPYCYDHVLEWMLQDKYILVPDVPRTTQLPGKGMTYEENPTTPIYQHVVKQEAFYVSDYKHFAAAYFPIIGTSALTQERTYFNLATQTTSQIWFWLLFVIISFIVCCLKCLKNNRNNAVRKWGRKKRS